MPSGPVKALRKARWRSGYKVGSEKKAGRAAMVRAATAGSARIRKPEVGQARGLAAMSAWKAEVRRMGCAEAAAPAAAGR